VEKGKIMVQNGKRLKMLLKDADSLPYVLGYIAYSAIEKTSSEKEALQLGLSAKVSEWVQKVEG